MDLKKLERWTRHDLESEARRLGAKGARALSRSELLRVIVLRMKTGSAWSQRAARWAQRVTGMPGPSRGFSRSDPSSRVPTEPPQGAVERDEPLQHARGRQTPPSEPGDSLHSRSSSAEEPAAPRAAEPGVPGATMEHEPRAASPAGPGVSSAPSQGAENGSSFSAPDHPTHPPQGAIERDEPQSSLQEGASDGGRAMREPIRTRSMARLLAAQGHRERALEVYEALMRAQPHDASLRHEAAALRSDPEVAPPQAPSLPHPDHVDASHGDDRVTGERVAGRRARVCWYVTEAGRRRAQQVLGGEGELALRTVLLSSDPATVVRSQTREQVVDASEGERMLDDVAPEARVFVAVGLRHHGRFAAIAHVSL